MTTSSPRPVEQIILLQTGVELDQRIHGALSDIRRIDQRQDRAHLKRGHASVPSVVSSAEVLQELRGKLEAWAGFGDTFE